MMRQPDEIRPGAGIVAPGLLVLLCIVLAACTARPAARMAPAEPAADIQPVFIATQRQPDRPGELGGPRADRVHYLRAAVSVPPGHEPGRIEWPPLGADPDPRRHFALSRMQVFHDAESFARDVRNARTGRETLVYVHGFNAKLSESIYRMAQMRADFRPRMPSVLYAWPSAGDPRGYVYDRDSVLFARDGLEKTLQLLTAGKDERVFLLAHSMGAQLVMEVLRQSALRGDGRLLSRISGVVLMSPDIDPEVFRRQAEAIGPLPQPFMILIARQDRALGLAGFLTGRKPRLGVIDSREKVAGLNVKVLDFTALADGEGYDHSVPVTSPAAITVLRGLIAQADRAGASGFADYMVLEAQY